MSLLKQSADPHFLVVGMTGVKLGDRVLQIGCAHGGRLAAVAAKVGFSGRSVAVVSDERSAARVRRAASKGGVLVEVETSALDRLPFDATAFDLVIVDDASGLLGSMNADERRALVREAHRILRPGGRVLVIGAVPRGGLARLFARQPKGPRVDPTPLLVADGFSTPRTLAERDGLVFVEAMKPRASTRG